MMKKILTKLGVAISILALSAFVTACGGDGGTDTGGDTGGGNNASTGNGTD
jgi:hypothetical protein